MAFCQAQVRPLVQRLTTALGVPPTRKFRSSSSIMTKASSEDPHVHVLGLGSIGTFAAFCLADIPHPPRITLLLHRPSLYERFIENERRIQLLTTEKTAKECAGFDAEVLKDGSWFLPTASSNGSDVNGTDWKVTDRPIENLIVATKTIQTVEALRPLQHRLNTESSVLFLQNGMGIVEEVNRKLFMDAATRPQFSLGVISHGVGINAPFNIVHTGFSATSVGPSSPKMATSKSYLLEALPQSHFMNANVYGFEEILQMQLTKLVVNSFCNPFCAIHDSKNAILLEECHQGLKRELLEECSTIIYAMPELHGVDGVKERFSADSLEDTVNAIYYKTRETTCSMVWDVRAGRETEIHFINGFWVRKGLELGIETPVNSMLVQEILKKHARA